MKTKELIEEVEKELERAYDKIMTMLEEFKYGSEEKEEENKDRENPKEAYNRAKEALKRLRKRN